MPPGLYRARGLGAVGRLGARVLVQEEGSCGFRGGHEAGSPHRGRRSGEQEPPGAVWSWVGPVLRVWLGRVLLNMLRTGVVLARCRARW